ncbi:AP-4 complex subunit epsilon-1 [Nymphon striatum]|nr:AP-4 complex subunit epsilon-1 [Nymphon striatum]
MDINRKFGNFSTPSSIVPSSSYQSTADAALACVSVYAWGIMHECISTVAVIDASQELIELALSSITSLLRSQDTKLKYIGLENLTKMVLKVKNCFDSKHQPAIIDCLRHPDISIQLKLTYTILAGLLSIAQKIEKANEIAKIDTKKELNNTLDLIYELCNEENVVVVTGKFLDFLQTCHDSHQQDIMVNKVLDLADKFSPSFTWYLGTVEKILIMGYARPKPSQMKIIFRNMKEGLNCSANEEFFNNIVQRYTDKCSNCEDLTPSFIQLSAWENVVMLSIFVDRSFTNNIAKPEYAQEIGRSIATHDKLKEMNICSSIFTSKLVLFMVSSSSNKSDWLVAITHEMESIDPLLSDQDEFVISSLQEGSSPYISRSLIVNQSLSVLVYFTEMMWLEKSDVAENGIFVNKMKEAYRENLTPEVNPGNQIKLIWTKEGLQALSSPQSSSTEETSEQLQVFNEDLTSNLFAGVQMT